MHKRTSRFLQALESHISLSGWVWSLLLVPGAGLMSGFAAKAAELLSTYAPFSYVAIGLGGALLMSGALAFYGTFRYRASLARLAEARASKPMVVNPLDDVFTKTRISIQDFAPLTMKPLKHKRFIECEIVGPAVLYFVPDETNISIEFPECIFNTDSCDWFCVKPGGVLHNVICFEHGYFKNCTFHDITFVVGVSEAKGMKAQLRGIDILGYDYLAHKSPP